MSTTIPDSGAAHLEALARDHRRQFGKVYTQDALAEFVLDQALGIDHAPLGPVLDPACGAGVFLVAVVRRIAGRMARAGEDVGGAARQDFLWEVRRHVWGIDSDPVAVKVGRRSLFAVVEELSPGPIAADFFDENLVWGDFLKDSLAALLPVAPSLIVGNPPYVATDRISAADKLVYRADYTTAFGRMDLYTLFMERAVRTLEVGGRWAFITPDKYLTSESARPLRELLTASGAVRNISVFDSHRVFQDAATVPCVTVWERGRPPGVHTRGQVEVSRVSLSRGIDRAPRVNEARTLDAAVLQASTWTFHRQTDQTLAELLTEGHRTLAECTQRISAGLATGYNPAFVLDRATAESLEPEIVHRTIRGRDVKPFRIANRDEYMLVPYTWGPDGSSRLIDLDDYPKTMQWLAQHEERLRDRHCVRVWGKQWWDLHDPVGDPLDSTPKVVVPDLARSNRFAADHGLFVPQHSVYYLQPVAGIDIDILTAILNSSAVEFLVRTHAPLAKDGFSRYRKQFLLGLPVPDVGADTQEQIRHALAERRHDDLDAITTQLFGVDRCLVRRALELLANRPRGGDSGTTGTGRVSTPGVPSPF